MIVQRVINGVEFAVNPSKGAGLLCMPEVAHVIDGDMYEFVEYLYEQRNAYTPMVATWELTNCCNFSCPFCYINTAAKPEAQVQTFPQMKEWIDTLVDSGLLLVYLTGGEVLSVPDFEKIYRYLKEKGVFVVLLTNLSLLSENHIALFRELPPFRITASIYGLTEDQFCAATRSDPAYCQTVLNNILRLKDMGIRVTCQMPVNTCTVKELVPIADWCFSHGIRFTFSNDLADSYYDESRNSFRVDDETLEELRKQIRQVEAEKSSQVIQPERVFGYKHHFDCISGRHTFAVSSGGHLRPCFNIWESYGPSFDGTSSMKQAMEKMTSYLARMRETVLEDCHGCEASQICGECMYTRMRHLEDPKGYMHLACARNTARLNEWCPVSPVNCMP